MSVDSKLSALGWSSYFEEQFRDTDEGKLLPARVAIAYGNRVTIATPDEVSALAPRGLERMPVVGDWVTYEILDDGTPVVRHVMERRSTLSRKVAGRVTREQVIAANVDLVVVVTSVNSDLNLRRIERYLATVWESGATPVVALSKSDLCEPPALEAAIELLAGAAPGVEILATSVLDGAGIDRLRDLFREGVTGVVVGSSGVGKSSLINVLVGEELLAVNEIRPDDKGRHTTTNRQLVALPSGGTLIDTPGMRELQMWEADAGLERAFPEIEALAQECRFRDCAHESEPGCAVRAAVASGKLERARFDSYCKLQRELRFLDRKQDRRQAAEETRRWKVIHKEMRASYKSRGPYDQ